MGSVVVFDWDCTVTCKHMYKCLAGWGGFAEDMDAWCSAAGQCAVRYSTRRCSQLPNSSTHHFPLRTVRRYPDSLGSTDPAFDLRPYSG